MIRVAAVGDLHYDRNSSGRLRAYFESLGEKADLLLVAGDLTQAGTVEEARALADDLAHCPVPVFSVLGNHDYHSDQQEQIREELRSRGVEPLEGDARVIRVRDRTVAIVGLKGFGGGFGGACCTEFGEPETKAFARIARTQAARLREALESVEADFKFVLLHYAPVDATLLGEKREIYPFLGSYLLAEAIDAVGADCVFHGHAHHGTERGMTSGGVPVRNVAQMVIRHAYNVYTFQYRAGLQAGAAEAALRAEGMPAV
jgi:Icc-related predicted phosphoesterase